MFLVSIASFTNVSISLDDCSVHSTVGLDGYITQPFDESLPSTLCSDTLSKYFGKPVHLVYKGSKLRPASPTLNFPNLAVGVEYQDSYPLLVASEESFEGVVSMTEDWRREQTKEANDLAKHLDTMVIERYCRLLFLILTTF
jgi:uncharacterized protein